MCKRVLRWACALFSAIAVWNDAPCSSSFLDFCLLTHAFSSVQKPIVENDIKSRYSEEHPTVDKVGIEKVLNPVLCRINRLLHCIREQAFILLLSHSRSRAQFYFFARRARLRGNNDDHPRSNRLLIFYLISKQVRLRAFLFSLYGLISQFRPRGVLKGLFISYAYIFTSGKEDIWKKKVTSGSLK